MKTVVAILTLLVLSFAVLGSTAAAEDGGFCGQVGGSAICQ